MKHLLVLAAFIFAATFTQAQTVDTVKTAIQVVPKEVNSLTKDTVYQLTWQVFNLSRDTSKGCDSYVQLFDRKARQVYYTNIPIPSKTVNAWGTNDAIIDDFILTFLHLTKRK